MDVRPSPIAGRWYPKRSGDLTSALDRYLAEAQVPAVSGTVVGIVAPHAGLRYSGSVAAYAFAYTQGLHPEIVVVVGPMHHPASAPLLTSAHDAYTTPLGLVEVDRPRVEQLSDAVRRRLGYGITPIRNDPEHAIEIELLFLQHVLGSFRLLPLMIRDQRAAVAEPLGQALTEMLRGRQALLVASSDLSHYYSQAIAHELDGAILQRVAAFDPQGVIAAGSTIACGSGAMAAVLWAARGLGANRVSVARYATSGDVSDNIDSVVGYGSAIIWSAADRC